jgi:Glycosyltransferase family 87
MRPPLEAASAPSGAWPTRRTVALLLVLLSAAIASSYWVEIVTRAFDDVDPIVHVPNYDFFQYYAGGYNWNLGLDPYTNHPGVARAIQHPRFDTHQISGYIYPPTLLPVYGALAHTTYDNARRAWLAITLSAFSLLIAVAVWTSAGRRLEVLAACLLLTMASYPFIYHVHNGQADLVSASLTIGAFLLYPRWRGWPTALLLALAVATKVTPVLILAVMVVYFRDWRLALKALACGLVLVALSLIWVHVGLYREFIFTTLPSIAVSDPSQFNQTVLRFWWKYPLVLKVASPLGYLALLFLVYVASRNRRRAPFGADQTDEQRRERNAVLLLAVLFMLFFSPLAWQMAYVWPIVPLALVLTARPPAGRVAVVTLGVAAALLCSRIYDVRVLDLLNVIGAAVAILALMRWYLPLDESAAVGVTGVTGATGVAADAAALDDPAARPTSS